MIRAISATILMLLVCGIIGAAGVYISRPYYNSSTSGQSL